MYTHLDITCYIRLMKDMCNTVIKTNVTPTETYISVLNPVDCKTKHVFGHNSTPRRRNQDIGGSGSHQVPGSS